MATTAAPAMASQTQSGNPRNVWNRKLAGELAGGGTEDVPGKV